MNTDHFFEQEHILENKRARLEPLSEVHYPHLLEIALEKEIWEFTLANAGTEPAFRKYFDQALEERKLKIGYPFAIFDKLHNRYAGSTRFGTIVFPHKKLEIGWTWYHPTLQRTGINKAAKYLLLKFGFETLGLNRIELKTNSHNLKSQGAMLKIGAVKEGTFRRHMINENGTSRDTVYFSFISDEWQETKERFFSDWSNENDL